MMAQFHNPQLHLHSCWILFWTIWLVLGLGLKITTYFGFMLQVLVYSWLAYVNRMLHCHVCQFGVFTLMDEGRILTHCPLRCGEDNSQRIRPLLELVMALTKAMAVMPPSTVCFSVCNKCFVRLMLWYAYS